MSTRSTTSRPVDLAPPAQARAGLALVLALLSMPGVTIAWDVAIGAGVLGVVLAAAAIVVGLQARARLAGAKGTLQASVAVAIGTLGLLSVVLFLVVGAPD